ncbi:MAG: hypothetical protein AB8G77_24470 [Rhodothermales bacterium]
MSERQFPCEQCGADLNFVPGTHSLACNFCGHENLIEVKSSPIVEQDYRAQLAQKTSHETMHEVMVVKCDACGAESSFNPNIVSDACPFCGTSIVQTGRAKRAILPQAVMPFITTKDEGQKAFAKWLHGLWFAPSILKSLARQEDRLKGMYIPYWTYDSNTTSDYHGQRGDYYYTTESYTAQVNGKSVRRTRQVRHTRWSHAQGRVYEDFDDVLIIGTRSLPDKEVRALGPWRLTSLKPYTDAYLSGFQAESYSVQLEEGFSDAKNIMDLTIRHAIRSDIGGDEQRILHKDTEYRNITFKHILLPIWISSYRYKKKIYRFMVNGQTGEVQGERPWSKAKIAATVIGVALLIAILVFVLNENG